MVGFRSETKTSSRRTNKYDLRSFHQGIRYWARILAELGGRAEGIVVAARIRSAQTDEFWRALSRSGRGLRTTIRRRRVGDGAKDRTGGTGRSTESSAPPRGLVRQLVRTASRRRSSGVTSSCSMAWPPGARLAHDRGSGSERESVSRTVGMGRRRGRAHPRWWEFS